MGRPKKSHDLPASSDPKVTWAYWVARDSVNGELSGTCSLWYAKPLRTKFRYRVTWTGRDPRDPCYLGQFTPKDIAGWFGTYPETDLELLHVEQTPTSKMLEEQRAALEPRGKS